MCQALCQALPVVDMTDTVLALMEVTSRKEEG